MINFIKRQFKKILIALGLLGVAFAALPTQVPAEYITAPENNTYKIGQLNYNSHLEEDITSPQPLRYQLNDKYIAFTPVEIRWDKKSFKTLKSSTAKIDKKKYLYKNAFGKGIDIDMNFGERVWEKVVKINSLEDLGEIPKADYLEVVYEVETNFIINGWNKKDDFEITEITRLGDFSYIEPAMVWDSYREEVCKIIDEEEICETLTNRVKIKSFFSENKGKLYLTKQIPVEWLKTAQYPIFTDTDVTYGTASTFQSGNNTSVCEPVLINTSKFAVLYGDTSNNGFVKVGTVSGTTITWGTASEFTPSVWYAQGKGSISKVDTDKIAVAYADNGLGYDGYTRIATTSGTTIGTWGTAVEFETGDMEYNTDAQLATDKYVICYNDESDSDTGKCVANTVSGTTITAGTPTAFDGGTNDYKPLWGETVQDGTDKFITCFNKGDGYGYEPTCFAGTVSTRTITFGTVAEANATTSVEIGLALLDTDKFVLCYTEEDSGASGSCKAGSLSGTTITFGNTTEFEAGHTNHIQAIAIDTTHFVVVYSDNGDVDKGKSSYCSVNWGTKAISCNTPEIFETGETRYSNVELVSSNKIVICYSDYDDNSGYGKCIIGDVAGAAAGTNMKINIGDAWKDVDSMKINIGDVWKDVEGAWINIGDSWKVIY